MGYETFDLELPQDILDATTTRDFTTRTWGGSRLATFPKIGKEFTHGLDDFMYISLLYAPHAPRWPGSPGLIFKFKDDGQEWPKIMRLIVRLRDNAWQYMGQYKLTAAPPLTPEEWNAQSHKVKFGALSVQDSLMRNVLSNVSRSSGNGRISFRRGGLMAALRQRSFSGNDWAATLLSKRSRLLWNPTNDSMQVRMKFFRRVMKVKQCVFPLGSLM